MNQEYIILFWLLVATAIISIIGILGAATSLKTLVKSDFFIDKLKEMRDAKKLKSIILLLVSTVPGALMAQEAAGVEHPNLIDIGQSEVVMMVVINIALIGVILFMRKMIKDMLTMIKTPEEIAVEAEEPDVVAKINHVLTDAVAIEDEHTILMDHEYDGIRELDNNLPPWWTYGFYLTILTAVIYLFNFHVLGTGDLQLDEYNKDMAESQAEVDAYLAKMALNVDESNVVTLMDAANLSAGKGIFIKNCAVCHLEDGGGQTGPNLTDDHWLYGPDVVNVFKTIKYGANNGMTAWQAKLTPVEIQQVSSFVRSLHGTTPATAKDPQGNVMEWQEDSAAEPAEAEVTADASEVAAVEAE